MANTFFDKWVDNRNNIVEDLSPDDPRRVAADAILDANKRKRERQDAADARAERALRLKERDADRKDRQERKKDDADSKRSDQQAKAEGRKAKQKDNLEKKKEIKRTRKALKATGKSKQEKTGYGDDSLKAGGVVASNLVRTGIGVGKKIVRGAQYAKAVAAAKKKKLNVSKTTPPSGGVKKPEQKRLPPGKDPKALPGSSPKAKQILPDTGTGQQARENPALKKKMIKDRGGTVTEGLRTAVKNVIKKVKAYQKKRKSIVKRDPDATAMATTKGSKMVKYEKQPSSVSTTGSSAVTSTAKKKVEPKKGKETEGQKARRDPDYRKKKIEQDVAAARKWVNRRKAVKAVKSVAQKAKDTASSAKEAGGKLVKSVASGKLARQIRTGAYKAKQAATKTGKKVAKATLKGDPTAKAGASARRTVHNVGKKFKRAMDVADRLKRMQDKGLEPGKGKPKSKSQDKPKSDGKVADPWNEGFSNWREEFLHEVEQPEMGETDQKEPDSKSKSKKSDTEEKKIDVMKGKNKVEVNPKLAAESLDHPIDSEKHKKAQKITKIRNLAKDNKNPNEKKAAENKAGGPKLYGEDSVMIQDADGNDFLEVIDVIKAEPLVPVKEGKVNGNGKQQKFNRAMNAYRKAQRAGNLSNKERVDRLKDNAKIRKDAEKKEKKGKQFAGGQVYNEDKKSKLVSIVKAVANEKKRKNALQIQKYVGEETPDAISGKDLKRISFLSGKKTRFGPEETAKRKAALAKKHGGEENIKGHPQFKEEKLNEISIDTANRAWNARKDIADKVRKVDSKEASKHDEKAANTARIIAMKERPAFGTTPKTTARQKRLNKIWEK